MGMAILLVATTSELLEERKLRRGETTAGTGVGNGFKLGRRAVYVC
jgi:hypothetical protein